MTKRYNFKDLQQVLGARDKLEVSLNDLYPKSKPDADGKFVPAVIEPVQFDKSEKFRLLKPYVSVRFIDQFKAVVPLAVYLALFLIVVLRQSIDDALLITGGLFAVIVGLMFFMEGLRIGLMPFGTIIGHSLPQRSPLPVVLLLTLFLVNTSTGHSADSKSSPFVASRTITCVVPDDGTDRRLIQSLRKEKGIQTATSKSARGISILRYSKARRD